jgi:hypothetical protein
MRKLLLVFALLLIVFAMPAVAQEFMIGVEGNFGFYSMASLKETQKLPAGYPVQFKSVQNFPVTPGFRVSALLKLHEAIAVGIFGGRASTGSRLAYSDFTGQTSRDVIVSGNYIGSYNRFTFFTLGAWSLHGRFSIGAVLNKVEFENFLHLENTDYESVERSEWRSANLFADLGIEGERALGRFYAKAFASYEIGQSGDADLKHGSNDYPRDRNFHVEWDGARLGLGLAYRIIKSKS